MSAIKSIYNFLVSFQLLCLIIFIFYLIESGMDLVVPIVLRIYIPTNGGYLGFDYTFSYDFHFNYWVIIGMLISIFLIYLLSSVNVAASGLSDSGTISIKEILSFLAKFSILNLPVIYLFSKSALTNEFTIVISLFSLIIYAINFLSDSGGEIQNG